MAKIKVALALGSGGARGLTQIGVIEELEKSNMEVVSISGTSIGSLIGGLYANKHLQDFKNWISNLDESGVFDLVDFTLNKQGFVKGERVFNEMRKFIPDVNIEDLPIPYAAVAADLNSHKEEIITQGNLFAAIRASVAVPSVLTPVKKNGQLFVDGGVVNPLPITALPKSKADITIAVNLCGPKTSKSLLITKDQDKKARSWVNKIQDQFSNSFKEYFITGGKFKSELNYFEVVNSSFDLMQDKLTEITLEKTQPDILVNVPRNIAGTFEFDKAEALIEFGRQEFRKCLKDFNN
jgi:NTE family protein